MITEEIGESPGEVVTGGDSYSESWGFEFILKIAKFVWKNEKEAGDGPFLKKNNERKIIWGQWCTTLIMLNQPTEVSNLYTLYQYLHSQIAKWSLSGKKAVVFMKCK